MHLHWFPGCVKCKPHAALTSHLNYNAQTTTTPKPVYYPYYKYQERHHADGNLMPYFDGNPRNFHPDGHLIVPKDPPVVVSDHRRNLRSGTDVPMGSFSLWKPFWWQALSSKLRLSLFKKTYSVLYSICIESALRRTPWINPRISFVWMWTKSRCYNACYVR